jgi:hypothetical protein
MFTKILLIILLFLFTILAGCSANYITVKVHKSALMPDVFEESRDSLITNGMRISSYAQRYYFKPAAFGGGSKTFTGHTIPNHFIETKYGSYYLKELTSQNLVIDVVGKLKGHDNTKPMAFKFFITSTMVSITMLN